MQPGLLPHAGQCDLIKARIFYSNTSVPFPAGRCIPCPGDYKNRRGIPALPFSKSTRTVPRPKPRSYPKELKTIGDHIRAWRIDNFLSQAEVAKILGVCEDSVVGWEMRGTIPAIQQIPGIIEMIGYLPVEIDTSTFGGRVTKYRYIKGLTPKEFGDLISADPSTVRDWEKGKNRPNNMKRKIVDFLLSSN